jgi:hypothetical protein
MLQQTLMFLATDSPPARAKTRAVAVSPPAAELPGQPAERRTSCRFRRVALVMNLVGNAAGLATLLAALWYSLWLAQALVPGTAL